MRPRHQALLVAALGVSIATSARASEPGNPTERIARIVSADPIAPTVRYGWLGGTRARGSAPIQLWNTLEGDGFLLLLTPLVELHNGPGQPAPFPFEYWRGRLMLEAEYREDAIVDLFGALRWSVSVLLEHESDHPSVQPAGGIVRPFYETAYKYVNDTALRAAVIMPVADFSIGAVIVGRLNFGSCTLAFASCEHFELRGVSGHVGLDLTFDTGGTAMNLDWAYFASAHLEYDSPSERTIEERRLSALTGLRFPTDDRGTFEIYGALQFGSEIGFLRNEDRSLGGVFAAWSP